MMRWLMDIAANLESLSAPPPEISRPAFVRTYGGSLNGYVPAVVPVNPPGIPATPRCGSGANGLTLSQPTRMHVTTCNPRQQRPLSRANVLTAATADDCFFSYTPRHNMQPHE